MKLHVTPSALELVTAVREFLQNEVMPGTEGRLQFHARVAANVLRTVERELATEDDDEWAEAQLGTVGAASEAALAGQIREAGSLSELGTVVDVLDALTRRRLQASNPEYLNDVADDDPTQLDHHGKADTCG